MTEPNSEQSQNVDDRTPMELAYAGPSAVESEEGHAEVALMGNLRRPAVRLRSKIRQPLRFREAMSALYAVVASDFRYVPKDRTAYSAYLRMKRETASLSIWQAQQAHFSWLLRNDPLAFVILDPVITVHPDQTFFEVFSKDEGSYAKLAFDKEAFEIENEPTYGTTNIDYSQQLFNNIQQMRSYRDTHLTLGHEGMHVATSGTAEVLEKKISLPDSWLRGFLQVQSAAALPMEHFSLSALDTYNLLRYLRMHADV